MAIGFNASGDYARRTANLPTNQLFTIAAWVKVRNITPNAYAYFMGIENATSSASGWALIGYPTGNTLETSGDASPSPLNFSPGISQDVWYYFALRSTATANRVIGSYVAAGGSTFTTTGETGVGTWTPAMVTLGNDSWDEIVNCVIAHARVWSAELTDAQLLSERDSATAVLTTGLIADWPMATSTDSSDISGNARSLTLAGTLTTETGPLSSGISGAAAITLGAATLSAASTVEITAVSSVTLGALTLVSESTMPQPSGTGDAAITLGGLTVSSAGTLDLTAVSNVTLGALTLSSTATMPLVGIEAAATITLSSLSISAKGYHLSNASVNGVLAVSSANGRYLANNAGPLFLAGFHTWYSVQDGGNTNPPTALDWNEYLTTLVNNGANFTKLWSMESLRGWSDDTNQWFFPAQYERTGPGTAADGYARVDLTKLNPAWISRLEERAVECGNNGVYVVVQFFQGWQNELNKGGTGNPVTYHPYLSGNNIQSLDGDQDNDGSLIELHQRGASNVGWAYQQAFVLAVLQRLNYLDNVIYEISNEDTGSTGNTNWQYDLIDYVQAQEALLPKQHLVGMTKQYPNSSSTVVANSGADWGSYDIDVADSVRGASSPVSMYDTDHTVGLTSGHAWIIQAFCNGHGGSWYMDEWDGALYGSDRRTDPTYQLIRSVLGYVRNYSSQIDLANATPQPSLASTGYCLAKTTGSGYQLFVFQPGSGLFTVSLTGLNGTFSLEWLRVSTGTVQAGSDVAGNGVRSLTPPWTGEVMAFLEVTAVSADAAISLGALALSAAGTLSLSGSSSVTLDNLTTAAAGAVDIAATAVVTLGDATISSTSTVDLAANANITLSNATLDSAGQVAITGVSAVTLDALTLSSTSTVEVTAVSAITLGDATLSSTSAIEITAVCTITLCDVQLVSESTIVSGLAGSSSITLEAATVASEGTLDIAGAFSVALDDLGLAAVGVVELTAVCATTLDDLGLSAVGAVELTAVCTTTLGDLQLVSEGTIVSGLVASSSITLDDLSTVSAATLDIAGAFSVTLDDLGLSAAGAVEITAVANTTLDELTLVADSIFSDAPAATLSVTLEALNVSATGSLDISADASLTLDDCVGVSTATLQIVGIADIQLADAVLLARGGIHAPVGLVAITFSSKAPTMYLSAKAPSVIFN